MIFSTLKHMILLRMHDPAAMRFSTPDPLMEKYPSLSPYTYCAANPLKYIDPTGMTTYVIDKNGNLKLKDETEKDDSVVVVDDKGKVIDTRNFNSKVIYGGGFKIESDDTKGKSYKFDYYQINGYSNAINLFIFLATNTKVEWSLILYGGEKDGRAYLSTSRSDKHEQGMAYIRDNYLNNSINFLKFHHNHASFDGGPLPSPGDIRFAEETIDKFPGNKDNIEFWLFVHDNPDLILQYYPYTEPSNYLHISIKYILDRLIKGIEYDF